ncbi:MAG: hypothetical protein ACTH31_12760 [Pseudoclavibacter sp.]
MTRHAPRLTVRARILGAASVASAAALLLAGCGASAPEESTAETAPATASPTETPTDATTETSTPAPTESEAAETTAPAGHPLDGTWCATPDSPTPGECLEVAYPTVYFEDGWEYEVEESGQAAQEGCTDYYYAEAPIGLYCPAGIEIALPDYATVTDVPGEDRIWNGQTGVLYVRS